MIRYFYILQEKTYKHQSLTAHIKQLQEFTIFELMNTKQTNNGKQTEVHASATASYAER